MFSLFSRLFGQILQKRGLHLVANCPRLNLSELVNRLQVTVAGTTTTSTNTVYPSVNDMDWFAGVAEEELLYYTGMSNDVDSLWAVIGSFVPPPPRPPYLPEESIATDGLTTCDLCSWAWRNDRHSFSLDGTLGKILSNGFVVNVQASAGLIEIPRIDTVQVHVPWSLNFLRMSWQKKKRNNYT